MPQASGKGPTQLSAVFAPPLRGAGLLIGWCVARPCKPDGLLRPRSCPPIKMSGVRITSIMSTDPKMLSRDIPFSAILFVLLLATGLSLLAATSLPPGPRGLAIAALSLTKAALVVLGFMRLHRESRALAGALIGYAALICTLAGLKVALAA